MQLIAQGAEAKIYKDGNKIIKDRFKKTYRIPELDESLRKQRTKKEAKLLANPLIPAPKLLSQEKTILEMEFIDGDKVRDILDTNHALAEEIGKKLKILHNHNIIHGDLTTSNMILNKEIFFIDFGLSFNSQRVEDKAVDIHLFKQALESRHYEIADNAFKLFLKGYNPDKELLKRFQEVESRGRNKEKY